MKLLTVGAITIAATLAGLGLAATGEKSAPDLRRVDCNQITIFAPQDGKSADDLCRGYGGTANAGAQAAAEGLVILVRNQPMGGFEGELSVR